MKFIQGTNRNQVNLFPVSLEQSIDEDNEVRIIDLFADSLPLQDYGFKVEYVENGRPAYHPSDLLKLYIYGYLNKTRSSRDLEKEVMVAIPKVAANAPNPEYNVENFNYIKKNDYYICPQGNKLTTTGTWHQTRTYRFKRYTTKSFMTCPVKDQCSKAKYGKGIQRIEYQEYINKNKERIEQNKEYYRLRQAIVEHPYGTIKRQWGFSYILTKKGKERASADVGLMFIAYNIRRIMNILGKDELKKYLEVLIFVFLAIYRQIRTNLSQFNVGIFFNNIFTDYYYARLNRLVFD